jgi:excisionase family DNA binding protein
LNLQLIDDAIIKKGNCDAHNKLIRGGNQVVEDFEFQTAEEVASFLCIPLSTVYKLTQDQKLPAFKAGKHWRYRKTAIQEWILKKEREHSSQRVTTL